MILTMVTEYQTSRRMQPARRCIRLRVILRDLKGIFLKEKGTLITAIFLSRSWGQQAFLIHNSDDTIMILLHYYSIYIDNYIYSYLPSIRWGTLCGILYRVSLLRAKFACKVRWVTRYHQQAEGARLTQFLWFLYI